MIKIIGIPFDANSSFLKGSAFAPQRIRLMDQEGSANSFSESGLEIKKQYNYKDCGDIHFEDTNAEKAFKTIMEKINSLLIEGDKVLSIGGDHSISHPVLKAVADNGPVGMIHIDAHCDTGGSYEGEKFHHGGPFRNAVLEGALDPERTIQIGIRGSAEYIWEFSKDSGMHVVHAKDINNLGIDAIISKAREIAGDGPTYLSFDIDSLDPAFAPGTGTPEVGGLTTRESMQLIRGMKGLNIVGGDVVEVAPQYDPTSNTAQHGAQMLFEILSVIQFSPALRQPTTAEA